MEVWETFKLGNAIIRRGVSPFLMLASVRDAGSVSRGPPVGNNPELRSRPHLSTDMAIFSGVNVTKGANKYLYSSFRASHVIGNLVAICRTGEDRGGL